MTRPTLTPDALAAIVAAQNELAYLRGYIPRPPGITAPVTTTERKRRIAALAAYLAVKGY